MIDNPLFAISVMAVAGFLLALLSSRIRLPMITGYIVAGIILSPSVANLISGQAVERLELVTPIGLGIIAYSIGTSLKIEDIRGAEKNIAWILPMQALGTVAGVSVAVSLTAPLVLDVSGATYTNFFIPLGLVFGSIAAATAPAATMAIVRECRAGGSLTTILLSMVALDDAATIILFSLASGVALPLVAGGAGFSIYDTIVVPVLEIAGSIGLGLILAAAIYLLLKVIGVRELKLVMVLAAVLAGIALSEYLEFSLILTNITAGFTAGSLVSGEDFLELINDIEEVIFVLFFVLAGLHFDAGALNTAGALALVVFAVRFMAKYYGCMAGAGISDAPSKVRKYLGLTMIPAAGVAIGLALLVKRNFPPEFGNLVLSGTLGAVIISELIAPPLAKYALERAGEANTC